MTDVARRLIHRVVGGSSGRAENGDCRVDCCKRVEGMDELTRDPEHAPRLIVRERCECGIFGLRRLDFNARPVEQQIIFGRLPHSRCPAQAGADDTRIKVGIVTA